MVDSESREISPFEFLGENDEGDFRPVPREIEPEVLDPKDESAPASASSLESTPIPESEPSATASTETSSDKEDAFSTATSLPLTNPGRPELPAVVELPSLPPIPTPGSQSEDKQTSPTRPS